MNQIKTRMLLLAALATLGLLAGAAQAGPTPQPSQTPTETPTPTPSASPTQTPQPPLEEGCFCAIKNVNPGGNIASLRNTATGGKGSSLARSVVANMKGENITPGSCPADRRHVVSVRMTIVDDHCSDPTTPGVCINFSPGIYGDLILQKRFFGFNCNAGGATNAKFTATYDVLNCKDSEAPGQGTSSGGVTVIVENDDETQVFTRKVQCKAN